MGGRVRFEMSLECREDEGLGPYLHSPLTSSPSRRGSVPLTEGPERPT